MIELTNIRFIDGFIYFFVKGEEASGNAIFSCSTNEIVKCDNKKVDRGTLWRARKKIIQLINEFGLVELPDNATYMYY